MIQNRFLVFTIRLRDTAGDSALDTECHITGTVNWLQI